MLERLRKEVVMDAGGLRPIPTEPSRLYRILPGVVGVTPLPRRVLRPKRFASTEAIARFMSNTVQWEKETNELCWIIPLDNHGRQMYDRPVLVSIGATDSVPMDVITIFRTALVMEAGQIILLHNHPTGDGTVSEADKIVSLAVAEAGRALRIPLERHIILAAERSRRVPEIRNAKNSKSRRQGEARRCTKENSRRSAGGNASAARGVPRVPFGRCLSCRCGFAPILCEGLPPESGGDDGERDTARRVRRREIREPEARRRSVRREK